MTNNFTATVRATRDAEVKEFGQSKACVVGLVNSTNQKVKDKWVENPLFLKGIVFGMMTERLSKVRKGDFLFVSGQLVNRPYTDKDGNEKQDLNLEISKFETISTAASKKEAETTGDLPF